MLGLKLQYFGHLMWRVDSLEKTLMLGGIVGRRRRGRQRTRWLDGIPDSMHMSLGELRELVMDREAWPPAIHGVAKNQTGLTDWNELNWTEALLRGRWLDHAGGTLINGVATAAAAKLLQSCLTLWDPIDGSPPGSPVPGILQARTQEWVAISFSNAWKWKVKMKSLSCVQLLSTL